MMSRIFGEAQLVLGWMGKSDDYSKLAIATLSNILDQMLAYKSGRVLFGGSRFEFEHVDEVNWLALFAFLQRLWFRRAWIVQEMVMAKNMVLICGSTIFHWSVLEEVLGFLAKSKLEENITSLAQTLMSSGVTPESLRLVKDAGLLLPGVSRDPENLLINGLKVNPTTSYAFVEGIKRSRDLLGFPRVQLKSERDLPVFQRLWLGTTKAVAKAMKNGQDPRDWSPSSVTTTTTLPSDLRQSRYQTF